MIRLSVLYPRKAGARFDMAYYCDSHTPLVRRLLGPALKGVSVEQGMAGIEPGSPAPFVAIVGLLFDSLESLQAATAPHIGQLLADVSNFTDIEPVMQVSEVKV